MIGRLIQKQFDSTLDSTRELTLLLRRSDLLSGEGSRHHPTNTTPLSNDVQAIDVNRSQDTKNILQQYSNSVIIDITD